MATQMKRATIYFDPELHKALKLKALETSRSITDLVNQSVRESLSEDAEDLTVFEERKDEALVSYDKMLKKLQKNGTI
ncbi:CopG family transcriptional regulator [Desulforhopalus sp. IMCC35007]|uniref:CopG family transcriptional regulator n=1 Tax=Desulforhopalus sp. IMCC35007 TaxID=2569543 RepID=UPI0010AE536B|nr:CopG family transcriptional regulator [Desulforhopalus sp. IMCC35007]TKB12413.1 CopG family transcriptional regulator [Desulforhopalus sp. IMCC35007]